MPWSCSSYGALQAFDDSVVASSFLANVADVQQIGLTTGLIFITFFGFAAIATNAEENERPDVTSPGLSSSVWVP